MTARDSTAWSPPVPPEPFEIEGADGGPLRGDLYGPVAPASAVPPSAVILCHGFRSHKDWGFMPFLASRLAEDGHAAIAFNVSGSGISGRDGAFTEPGRFRHNTYTRELDDLGRVIAWAERRLAPSVAPAAGARAGATLRVGLAGHSRGGAIALIHAASDPRVRAVVAIGTPRAIGVWPEEYYRAWERGEDATFLDFRTGTALSLGPQVLDDIRALGDRCDVTRAVGALGVPLLVLQGERDTLVTMDEARALAAAGASNMTELRVVPGGGHGFQAGDTIRRTPPQLLEMTEATAAWMRRWLRRDEPAG